ncbi:HAD-IA family hydrolase [Crossiella sp. CA-258035]|uniref:HAD-IA family hydrolase n=1 Tax=Crossiella sp. CA-258035 TaxID=2981138 RepID=UPI0024BD06A0|nr:HAD-IA family hydrolase [Crossiella sp. CA-258035]WHT21746.1 HAD-IA family hydrolase [Crossiella sp. CA-258035]
MTGPAAVLLDLDGVLVDSMPAIRQALTEWSVARGFPPELANRLAHGRRTVDLVRLLTPELDEAAEVAAITALEAAGCRAVRPIRGAAGFLAGLGQTPWAVVTSGLRQVSLAKLTAAGLPIPEVLVCAEDVLLSKPDPECYLRAARELGAEPGECLVVEDALAGFEAARAAGMDCVGLGPAAVDYPGELRARIADLTELQPITTGEERT